MKNTLFRNLLLLCGIIIWTGLAGCSDDPDVDSTARLAVEQETFNSIESEGGPLILKVRANCHWELVVEDNAKKWITSTTTTGMGDMDITLTVSQNRVAESRTGVVYIIAANKSTALELNLTQLAGEPIEGEFSGYKLPISDVFFNKNDASVFEGAKNGEIDAAKNKFTFTEGGMIFERIEGEPNMEYAWSTPTSFYEIYLKTTGWDKAGAAWIITVPVSESLSGKLRFMSGMRTTGALKNWSFEWSNDYATWNTPANNTFSASTSSRWKYIFFEIPADKSIPAGGVLYIKLSPTTINGVAATDESRFDSGVTITEAAPAPAELPSGENILFTEGFDELTGGGDYFLPIWYMKSADGGAFTSSKYFDIKSIWERPGCVKLGSGNTAGALTTNPLTKLGENTADLKVSFKACLYEAATGAADKSAAMISVSGAGTIENGNITGLNTLDWTQKSVVVKNATKDTKVTFTASVGGSRYFIDDIVIESTSVNPPDPDKVVDKSIAEVRALKSNVATSGSKYTIPDNWRIKGVVVSDRTAKNIDSKMLAIVDQSKESSGIMLKTTLDHLFNVGEEVEVLLKDAVLANTNGGLTVTPSADTKITKTAATTISPQPTTITSSQLLGGAYESMYVAIANTQVVKGDLSKNMEGNISMETMDASEFNMQTLSTAIFKTNSVPQGSGTLKGLCSISGSQISIAPVAATDLAAMTGQRFGETPPTPQQLIKPMVGIFWNKDNNDVSQGASNGSISGNTFTFSDTGYTIERLGGTSHMKYTSTANYYEINLETDSWDAENSAWLITMPCTETVFGDLRVMFGNLKSTSAIYQLWKVQWSNDNTNWEDCPEEHDFKVGTYKTSFFTIPEAKKITAGNKLYIKILPTDRSADNLISGAQVDPAAFVKIWAGFYVASAEPVKTTFPTGDNVIFTHGFDDATKGADYLLPLNHMASYDNDAYAYEGFTLSGVKQRPGYVRLGGAKNSALTTPALAKIGDTPTDITVTFKACIYKAATDAIDNTTIQVDAVGGGTIDGANTFSGVDPDKMQTISVVVKGATKDTKIKFSATAATSSRFFLDDIVVTKN